MPVSPLDKVRNLYEESADSYSKMMDDEIGLPIYGETLDYLAARIAALDGSVLDTSCGSGHMLEMLRDAYTPGRMLLGIDLSPRMVEISRRRLGAAAEVAVGEMQRLEHLTAGSCAAVLSFFALHHLDADELCSAFAEWYRVLCPDGQLLVGAWEGEGAIDYGEHSDIVAVRYREATLADATEAAGFRIDRCEVRPVDGMAMDAVYLMATK